MKKYIICLLLFGVSLSFSCGKKVYIPEYNTAKEQYEFAKLEKDKNLIIVDKDKRKEKYEAVVLAFKKVITKFPEDKEYCPLAMISIGDSYRLIDEYAKGAESYEEALKLYGNMEDIKPFALYGAALCYDHLKDFTKAQYYYKTILDNYENSDKKEIQDLVKRTKDKYSKIKIK